MLGEQKKCAYGILFGDWLLEAPWFVSGDSCLLSRPAAVVVLSFLQILVAVLAEIALPRRLQLSRKVNVKPKLGKNA